MKNEPKQDQINKAIHATLKSLKLAQSRTGSKQKTSAPGSELTMKDVNSANNQSISDEQNKQILIN
jgi:hypothetical protein